MVGDNNKTAKQATAPRKRKRVSVVPNILMSVALWYSTGRRNRFAAVG
jgi:hypothetical protein